jgi:hypothetical protein
MSCETLSSSIQNAVKRCRTLSHDNDFFNTLRFLDNVVEISRDSRQRCREIVKYLQFSMQIIKNDDNVVEKSLSRDNVRQRLTAFCIELDNVSQLI